MVPELPDSALAVFDDHDAADARANAETLREAGRDGDRFTIGAAEIALTATDDGLAVSIGCPAPLSRVGLRWRRPISSEAMVLGDHWERSYGDLSWEPPTPGKLLPWSFLAYDRTQGSTFGMGVRVRPRAFCSWSLDADGVTLWIDVRNGGAPVLLGDRVLEAATIVTVTGDRPLSVQRGLAAAMCSDPLPSRGPIVGANNWYYAYGVDFGPSEVLRDAETVVELADGHRVRPYAVVDAGWSLGGVCPGGPWTHGIPGLFDDMQGLARDIAARGARPGIWMRPAALSYVDDEARLRPGPRPAKEQPLDLTLPENLETIRADVARLVGWGFELVKHDFSTFDMFGRWGPAMGADMTEPGWSYADRGLTNAEILSRLYRIIREGAGDAVVIGCNTVGHLAAGLVDVQRTGDDTSGREWERTARMGVNTLAFRLAQHGTFFTLDADCVPCTPQTPWEKNRQFLDLVARSGTALFVSVDPNARTARTDADLRAALRLALDGGVRGGVEPLDWLDTPTPRMWQSGGDVVQYDWSPVAGHGA